MTLDPHRIGAAIREGREALGLSQGEAAAQLGIHQSEWSQLECGRRLPSLVRFAAICDGLFLCSDSVLRGAAA